MAAKKRSGKRKSTGTGSKGTIYIVTARFPNKQVVPIRAVGAAGKAKALALIKKHSPSAKVTIRKG